MLDCDGLNRNAPAQYVIHNLESSMRSFPLAARYRRRSVFTAVLLGLLVATYSGAIAFTVPQGDYHPEVYACFQATMPPTLDGKLNDPVWQDVPWTNDFVDIEGDRQPAPRLLTRVKMLWDEDYFYVAAELTEPDVWATLRERDSVIFHDNDFEIFIDPDGDNHEYYELEINALGTEWDLLLVKPYRDGGPAIDAWDIQGLRTAVHIDGTLNDPTDTDGGWTIEIALPWSVLEECAHQPAPPEDGNMWHVNFSRVEWNTEEREDRYVKLTDPKTGKPLPEHNWVWSPQGLINMHYPERWGLVRFMTGEPRPVEAWNPALFVAGREILMAVYYQQRIWHEQHGSFTDDLDALGLKDHDLNAVDSAHLDVSVSDSGQRFEACFEGLSTGGTIVCVDETGHLGSGRR